MATVTTFKQVDKLVSSSTQISEKTVEPQALVEAVRLAAEQPGNSHGCSA